MNEAEYRELCEWGAQRDEKLYAWLRHLILLGAGSLSVLVSLQPAQHVEGFPSVCMKAAWICLGLGILFASVRLYAEVFNEKEKVKALVKFRIEKPAINGISQNEPITPRLPWYIHKAEPTCYICFVLAVIFIVITAILKT
jgi:hypothetical protein